MKQLLNIILVLVTFLACYAEDIYLFLLPQEPEEVTYLTIRSHRAFNFDQEKALGGKRQIAVSQYVPLYTYIPDRTKEAKKQMEDLIKKVSILQAKQLTDGRELVKYLRKEFGLEFRKEVAAKLLWDRNLKKILDGILTIEESILQSKIVEDPEPLKGKENIEILYPEPTGIVPHPASELITLEDARRALQEKVRQLFWQVKKGLLEPVLQVSAATLLPNLKYDQIENDRRIEQIIRQYPSKLVKYKPGDVLVPFKKTLREKYYLLLDDYKDKERRDFFGKAPWMLFAIVLTVVMFNLFLSRVLAAGWRKKPPYRLLLSLLILTVVFFKAFLLFTQYPIFLLPFAFLPLVVVLLHRERVSAIWTTMVGAILVSLICGPSFEIFLFFTFGGVAAVLASFNIRKRIHLFIPSLVVGLINAGVLMFFSLDWEMITLLFEDVQKIGMSSLGEVYNGGLLENIGYAFLGGIVSGPAALAFLPLLEVSWHTASAFKLNRYADLQHPIMRDLLTKTPGTYQHTMTVAYFAQTVGDAIGANTLLLRIGAYYHDIGKMVNSKLFVENQFSGSNPHDNMDPYESTKLIINHVRSGEKVGREMGLPESVLELIPQHHGTLLMEYFYDKAVKANPDAEIRMKDFRYPGPKPQTLEAAILMIVDAVEAASRSIQEPTREKAEKMVRLMIEKRLADGQFDECDLSTRDMAKIVQTLVDSLEASFHSRVVYPWQEEEEKEKEKEVAIKKNDEKEDSENFQW